MTAFPGSPRLVRGGIVLIDPDSGAVQRVIALQYNPDTLTRTLQPQAIGGEAGDRLEALRLKGPAIETIKLDAELDATDALEFPDRNPSTIQFGIYPQLAALETIIHPSTSRLQSNRTLAQIGTLEIAPIEQPLTLFIWSKSRILPIRLTEFSITEEAFDPQLNPIRARVGLGMRVLSVNDLPPDHRGSSLFLAYLQTKENLAGSAPAAGLNALGIGRIS
jgi:hypothetical protein